MKQNPEKRAHFYYIAGADGTGKSTQSELLAEYLEKKGIRIRRVWLRFPFFLSLPLLAYARIRGYSWHEVNNEVDHGYWDFSHSWVMKNIFPWALFIDASLSALFKIYLPLVFGETIICERFVLDMLVDLAIAVNDTTFSECILGRLFLGLLPSKARIVILDLDRETICRRRHNLIFDHLLDSRLNVFRLLANRLKLPVINSYFQISEVFQNIIATMVIA